MPETTQTTATTTTKTTATPKMADQEQELTGPAPSPQHTHTTPAVPRRRPARVQVDPETVDADGKPPQTGTIFNIWFAKWSGGDSNDAHLQTHAKTRVNIRQDAGYTRADRSGHEPVFCLYFARGACCMGKKCEYLHRLPDDRDRVTVTHDCFGREKFADYRDDMGGVGNFNRVNRTLYIGRINDINAPDIDAKITRNFGEFGDIEKSRVVYNKNVAFVTYKNELNAQFAKEAMAHQSLDRDNANEVLNIRWANEDPDPEARKRNRAALEQQTVARVKSLLAQVESKRPRLAVEDAVDAPDADADSEADAEAEAAVDSDHEQQTGGAASSSNLLQGNGVGAMDVLRRLKAARAKHDDATPQGSARQSSALKSALSGYDSSSDEE